MSRIPWDVAGCLHGNPDARPSLVVAAHTGPAATNEGIGHVGGVELKGYLKYFLNKLGWFYHLCFRLPLELHPAAADAGRSGGRHRGAAGPGHEQCDRRSEDLRAVHGVVRHQQTHVEQFFVYIRNVLRGDFGFSFSQYPASPMSSAHLSGGRSHCNFRRSSSAGLLATRSARWQPTSRGALTRS
jgi:hypothetical protein